MTSSIADQTDAFLSGFHDVIPPSLIAIFSEAELELLIAGLPEIDIADLRANTIYSGFRPDEPTVLWFWTALESLDRQDRARFLMFVTGTSKVPLGGFKALHGQRGPQKFTLEYVFISILYYYPYYYQEFSYLSLYFYFYADVDMDHLQNYHKVIHALIP
jgi:E3 ubiquitin-protein ligase HUWE1